MHCITGSNTAPVGSPAGSLSTVPCVRDEDRLLTNLRGQFPMRTLELAVASARTPGGTGVQGLAN
jgi:hypothetical protein